MHPSSLPRASRLILILAVLLALPPAPPPLQAQAAQVSFPIVSDHDFDSGTMTYCLLSSIKDATSLGNIKTTGATATVDAATGTPFTAIAPGDTITVQPGSNNFAQVRYVVTKASSAQITVNDPATDWSGAGSTGYPWSYRNLTCGTSDSAGWFNVSDYRTRTVHFSIEQLVVSAGSVAVQIDCKGSNNWDKPTRVYPPSAPASVGQCDTGLFTVAGATARCEVVLSSDLEASACRFGVSLTDDGGDTGTNRERITASFTGRK
jgi:hypothetical protein